MNAKGRVYKRGDCWFYRAYDSQGKPVLMDNTGDWRRIFDACVEGVRVVRYVEAAGHRFQHSYPELVDMAAGL